MAHDPSLVGWLHAAAQSADSAPLFAQEAAALERMTGVSCIVIAAIVAGVAAVAVWRWHVMELRHDRDSVIPRLAGGVITAVFILALMGKGVNHWLRGTYAPRVVVVEKAAQIAAAEGAHR